RAVCYADTTRRCYAAGALDADGVPLLIRYAAQKPTAVDIGPVMVALVLVSAPLGWLLSKQKRLAAG
ncbi:hypothetical protein AB0A60_34855, partial [Streptomyces sp. NPDC046275]|uniref:hypothetical protein n=1 Tax=Streptomyces sp. NPDC046275 TaxID=3157201 RepID=UPI0033F72E7E